MPYLIVTSQYPSDKAPEVANKYIEAISKFPPNESLATWLVPAAVKGTHQGIQTLGIIDVKKGKLDEAYNYMVSMMAMFHVIQAFEYKVDVYLKVEEAMGVIGMGLPT
jgi:hypothetical protein